MRNFAYSAAITTAIIVVGSLFLHWPQSATASSPAQANTIVTPSSLESTIDVKSLPTYDVDCRC
jgi:hypothetical protein